MDGGIGTASGLLTLLVFVYTSSKTIYEQIASFKDRRKTIRDAHADVKLLSLTVEAIRNRAEETSDLRCLDTLHAPLATCAGVCKEIEERLQLWTKHSTETNNSIRDWIKMQYQGKGFEDIMKRLAHCQRTLDLAFQVTNIDNNITMGGSLEVIKLDLEGTRSDIEQHVAELRVQIQQASKEVRESLEEDRKQLSQCLDTLIQAQRTIQREVSHISIERNRVGRDGHAIFGTDNVRPQFDLTVSDNIAGDNAIMASGVHTPETLQALLKLGQKPVITQTLQMVPGLLTHSTSSLGSPVTRMVQESSRRQQNFSDLLANDRRSPAFASTSIGRSTHQDRETSDLDGVLNDH